MAVSECPKCAAHIISNPIWREEMEIACPECGAKLHVIGVEPLLVESAEEEE